MYMTHSWMLYECIDRCVWTSHQNACKSCPDLETNEAAETLSQPADQQHVVSIAALFCTPQLLQRSSINVSEVAQFVLAAMYVCHGIHTLASCCCCCCRAMLHTACLRGCAAAVCLPPGCVMACHSRSLAGVSFSRLCWLRQGASSSLLLCLWLVCLWPAAAHEAQALALVGLGVTLQ